VGDGVRFTLSAALAAIRIGSHVDGALSVGVRPQHLRLGPPSHAGEVGIKGIVMVTEQLGDEQVLAVRVGAKDIRVAGIDPDMQLAPGAPIEVSAAADNLHFFAEE
jgi:ABC-type sugar transport system ATPase subunit